MRGFNHRDAREACGDQLSAPPKGPASGDLTGQYPSPSLVPTGVVEGTYTEPIIKVDTKGRVVEIASGPQRMPYTEVFLRVNNQVQADRDAVVNFDHAVTHGPIAYEDGFITIVEAGDYQITLAAVDATSANMTHIELVRERREGYMMHGAGFVTLPLTARDRLYFVNRGNPVTFTKPTNTNTTYASVRRVR